MRIHLARRRRIVTMIDQLDAALEEADLQKNSFGEKYSIYSFRHFYAVNALRNGIGVFEVARNMGTSVQIIQSITANKLLLPCSLRGLEISGVRSSFISMVK